MNDLQKTELALLKAFDRVCRQLRLTYFLVCGSALGAVKYGGFIPWDDDIDVAMYREDYEVFIAEAPALLEEGLFLQNYHSEPWFPQIYSKLRNSNTTYIETSAGAIPMNHGVFIDIFPLDGYPRSPRARRKLEFFKRLYGSMLLSAFDVPRGKRARLLCRVWRGLGIHKHPHRVASALERLITKYPPGKTELICNHGNWQGKLDYSPAAHFGRGREAEFEGISVLVPDRFDAYLRQKYGDYTLDSPPEEQTGHHYYLICDCTKPYTEYEGKP